MRERHWDREQVRALFAAHVLEQTLAHGHVIPRIIWEAGGHEGSGMCTRCGDGVLLYCDAEGCEVNGTAYSTSCPGNTCAHGWRVVRRAGAGTLMRCLHCGAERRESGPDH